MAIMYSYQIKSLLDSGSKQGSAFAIFEKIVFVITFKIQSKDSPDSKLRIDYTRPVKIFDILKVIAKESLKKSQNT